MKTKHALLSGVVLLFSFVILKAWLLPSPSEDYNPDNQYCATDEIIEKIFKTDPEMEKKHQAIEKAIYEDFTSNSPEKLASPPPFLIPVVVHIIHQNGLENISDAQVLDGIDHLNQAFANIDYYDQGTGVNTQIQFCLAKRTPEGTFTTGINRVESALTNLDMNSQDLDLKNLIRWDPLSYVNIWLVGEICSGSSGCGVAGYAYLPSAHGSNVDGIVQEARWFGSSNANSGVQVHEMGHYLGLYHTFQGGCTNDDCMTDGDRVCDTPPDNSTVAVPCNGSANSCTTDTNSGFATDQNDMFWDYMDYGNWSCYSAFTQGQAERMHWFIENVRESLLESEGCNDPCSVNMVAGFMPNANQTIDIGTTINFTNTSTDATIFDWQIDGTSFSSLANPDYTFNTLGTFEITLFTTNADPNCHDDISITVTVVCPVEAAFSSSNLYPLPGEIVNFTNGSSNASDFIWTVNGSVASNSTDFTYVFPSTGIYTVCVEASNGLCEFQYCQTLFASAPSESCEDSTFVKIIGDPLLNEQGSVIIPSGDGNFFIGAAYEGAPYLLKMSPGGVMLWEHYIPIEVDGPQEFLITDMIVDSEGMLVACGFGGSGQGLNGFVFKYDPVLNNVLWVQNMVASSGARSLLEPMDATIADHYILFAETHFNAPPGNLDDFTLMKLNRTTGDISAFSPINYTLGASQSSYASAFVGSDLYTMGRYTYDMGTNLERMRFGLTKMDQSGNEAWSKMYHVPQSQNARLYNRDFVIENQEVFMIGDGDDDGSSTTAVNPFMVKTDLDGNLEWVRKYELFGIGNVNAVELVSTPESFFMLGRTVEAPFQFYVMSTDKNGQVQWAKSYSFSGSDNLRIHPLNQMIVEGGFLYLTAETGAVGGAGTDILVVKMDLQGNTVGDCVTVHDLGVEDYYIEQATYTDVDLVDYDSPVFVYPNQSFPIEIESPVEGCGCQQDTIPCEDTFVKTFGTSGEEENGRKIIAEPNGGFIMGATKGDSVIIALLGSEAEMIWQRSFKFTDQSEFLADLNIDSDGNLLGVGVTDLQFNNRENFAFKYDYQNNNMLWSRILDFGPQSRSYFSTILELSAAGNYIIGGSTAQNNAPGLGCDAFLMEVDRNNGAEIWSQNYNLGSCESFSKIILHANSIYGTGRYNFAGGGTDKMRQAISQVDLSGNELWTRLYLVSVQNNARMYSSDIIADNGLIVIGRGDTDGTSPTDVSMQMFKTDYSGNIDWARDYSIPGAQNERFNKILNLPDGYLLLGNYFEGTISSMFMAKTDKTGAIQWSKKYGGTDSDFGYDIIFQNGFIYLLGETENYGLGGANDVFLAKLMLDGTLSGDCPVITDITITESDFNDPYDGIHDIVEYDAPIAFPVNTVMSNETNLEETVECFVPCETLDTCIVLPEAELLTLEALCQGDSLEVFLQVCNWGNGILPQSTPVTFYEGDPTVVNASVLNTFTLPDNLEKDSCHSFNVYLATPVNAPIYAVVNDDGTTLTPFDLTSEDFSNTDISECDYLNNLASFDLDYMPPVLDLGPDTVMCDFSTVTLDAGAGFYEYNWFNGAMDQEYTCWEPGTYWVMVTDSCGGVQTDTVTISIIPETVLEVAQDTSVCPGTITLTASGFDKYQWFPESLVSCDTCSTVEVNVDSLTVIEVVGEKAPGCYSVDTITIDVLPPLIVSDTVQVCEGDTVMIFENLVFAEGNYTQTFSAENGCDSIHTTTLKFSVDTILTEQFTEICQGDSLLIFGNFENTSGVYTQLDTSGSCVYLDRVELNVRDTFAVFETMTICELDTVLLFGQEVFATGIYHQDYQSVYGCDSTRTVELTVLDSVMTQEVISICDNETADVFGTDTNEAGDYYMTFTGVNNCDSTHMIRLEVQPTVATEETIVLCPGDSALVFGVYENIAGDYAQSFAAENNCDSTHTVHLQVLNPMIINFDVQHACSGQNDGSIDAGVTGGLPGYNYQWSTGQMSSSLENLEPGIYGLTVTDQNGCLALAEVNVPSINIPDIAITTEDPVCFGDLTGSVIINSSQNDLLYSLDGEIFQSTPVFNNLLSGTYEVFVQDAEGCVTVFDVNIPTPAELILSLPQDTSIHLGDSIAIQSLTNASGDTLIYQWMPEEALSCFDCPSVVASPEVSTLYTLTMIDENGCLVTEDIWIQVVKDRRVYIPNVFSPNNDGINDVFYINAGGEVAEINKFHIYDRWGNHVFSAENFQPNNPAYGWDGDFNGQPMNSAVLVYYAEITFVDGLKEVFKGEVLLMR